MGCEEDRGKKGNSVTGHSAADCLEDQQREAAHDYVEDKIHNTEMCWDKFSPGYHDIQSEKVLLC